MCLLPFFELSESSFQHFHSALESLERAGGGGRGVGSRGLTLCRRDRNGARRRGSGSSWFVIGGVPGVQPVRVDAQYPFEIGNAAVRICATLLPGLNGSRADPEQFGQLSLRQSGTAADD